MVDKFMMYNMQKKTRKTLAVLESNLDEEMEAGF